MVVKIMLFLTIVLVCSSELNLLLKIQVDILIGGGNKFDIDVSF